MFYVIEKQENGWIIYVHGVAILRCAEPDIALEVVRAAQALLGETSPPASCGDNGASLSTRR